MFTSLMGILLLCLCGTAGCAVFRRLRLPLPALLGSLAFTAVLALSGHFPEAPVDEMSTLCKIAIGAMVGRRINRNSLRMMRQMSGPVLLISVWMLLLSVVSGKLLALLADIPLSTALIACATGGVSEMAIFALSQNDDVAIVTIIQSLRLVAAIAMTPWLAQKWSARLKARGQSFPNAGASQGEAGAEALVFSRPETALLIVLTAAGGVFFQFLEVPAGALLGALAVSGGMGVARGKAYPFPQWLISSAQIGMGIAIAQQFAPEQVGTLLNLRFLLSAFFSTGFVIAGTLMLGYLLQRMTRWNPLTCLLSTSAGGLSQMLIVAEEMGADSLTIGVLHLARYLVIVSGMPLLITYLLP